MKFCLNPGCPDAEFSNSEEEDSTGICLKCGAWSCERCGSFFDPEKHLADRCIYCDGKGRIDCDEKERNIEFCHGCGNPCSRLYDLEDEFEND